MRFRAALAGGLLLAALALGGCANPIQDLVEQGIENGLGDGVDIDTDNGSVSIESDDGSVSIGGGGSVPEDFPGALPLPSGDLTGVVAADGGWMLSYTGVSDEDAAALFAHFPASGYSTAFEQVEGANKAASYANDDWAVTLIRDGTSDGGLLVYTVVPAS